MTGVVEQTASRESLLLAIPLAAQGKTYATADWAGDGLGSPPPRRRPLPTAAGGPGVVCLGGFARAVAMLTALSQDTVQDYLGRIRTRYSLIGRSANTRTDLLIRAQEDGYLSPPPTGWASHSPSRCRNLFDGFPFPRLPLRSPVVLCSLHRRDAAMV